MNAQGGGTRYRCNTRCRINRDALSQRACEQVPRISASQSGFTLLEMLLSIAIGLILLVPVGAWMTMAMRQQGPTATRFSEASQARIANTYLSRDVGSAELVRTAGFGPDAGCGTDAGDSVFLQLVDDTGDGTVSSLRTVYVTNTDGGITSVWRRQCRTADPDVVEEQTHVLRDVVTTAGEEPSAVCAPVSETDCTQVTFTAKLAGGAPVNVRAMRRATLDASYLGTDGNFRPGVKIIQTSASGFRPNFVVELDGSESSDLDGTIVSWQWSVADPSVTLSAPADQPSVAATFSALGTYWVTLEVTDDAGDTATKSHQVTVRNVAPSVRASVSPSEGSVQGQGNEATFAFDTTGTADPEGDNPLGYSWQFGDGVDSAHSTLSGPSPSVQFLPTATLGTREVTLTVTDSLGASTVERIAIRLKAPDGSDPEPAGDITIATDGELGGTLVNTAHTPARAPRAGTVGPGRPAVTVEFSTVMDPPFTWELRRGATVVQSSTDATFSHAFADGDAGDWTIAVVPDDGGTESTRSLRLNAAPVAGFSVTGSGAAPSLRSFDPGGSSDEHAIVSWNWNFGFFENWTSSLRTPDQTFTHPGSYPVALTVTDDDGAATQVVNAVAIAGTLQPPPAGSFASNTYNWAAVPGAEKYQVHLEVNAAPGCTSPLGPVDYEIAVSEAPSLATAYARCAVTARHRLFVSGSWGPYSPTVVRP